MKKKNKIILEDNESYKDIADDILKSDVNCYTKYINDFYHDRVLNKKETYYLLSSPMFKLSYR